MQQTTLSRRKFEAWMGEARRAAVWRRSEGPRRGWGTGGRWIPARQNLDFTPFLARPGSLMLCNDGCSQRFLRLAAAIISPTGKSLASDRRFRSKAILMAVFEIFLISSVPEADLLCLCLHPCPTPAEERRWRLESSSASSLAYPCSTECLCSAL